MASSLLILLDDIAAILDDVSVMTKVAMKKTAGVLGDDLALNAQQVSGVKADRELPVFWAVAKVVDGQLHGYTLTGMAGVANIGSDRNWSGSHFDQANWYTPPAVG